MGAVVEVLVFWEPPLSAWWQQDIKPLTLECQILSNSLTAWYAWAILKRFRTLKMHRAVFSYRPSLDIKYVEGTGGKGKNIEEDLIFLTWNVDSALQMKLS